jgi:hypothetical protein
VLLGNGRHASFNRERDVPRRGLETWYICDRASGSRGEPNCQSIAGGPIDEAVGALITEKMTPAAIDLALEIRREIEVRYEEADRLRHRAVERAQIEVELAQRRYMLVDPTNRLVADTLEREWNDKLRALAKAQEERERGRQEDLSVLKERIRRRLASLTTDFKTLWLDPSVPNRERKRLLACIIEDATLVKCPDEGTTKVHIRFKGNDRSGDKSRRLYSIRNSLLWSATALASKALRSRHTSTSVYGLCGPIRAV